MTSNQKSVLEPVARGKESGETNLIQQYLHIRICKKQKYIDSNLVTILKRGAVDAAGTRDDNVEMEADVERRCQLSVSPRPPT